MRRPVSPGRGGVRTALSFGSLDGSCLLNLGVAAARPVPQGLALTIRQREEIHAGWDKPKAATMAPLVMWWVATRR